MTQVVDSKKHKLSENEIVSIAAQETGSHLDGNQVAAFLQTEVQKLGAKLLREGNTIFVIHPDPKDKTRGVFRALNADTASNYIENGKVFVKAACNMGYKVLVTQFQDPTILNVFKAIARKPPLHGMGYAVQRTQNGGYQVTINVGTQPKGGLPEGRLEPKQGGLQ